MGTVYRKTFTKPLPKDAEILCRGKVRLARWKDRKGKSQTAAVITNERGELRLSIQAKTYTAKYRDGEGVVREVATGCKDGTAANGRLRELERRAELVKAGVMTSSEDAIADWQAIPLTRHFADYIDSLRLKTVNETRIANMSSQWERICRECRFIFLADLKADPFVRWLKARKQEGMSAATRNGYRESMVMFCNWCIGGTAPRLSANPFKSVPKDNPKNDPRRKRRAATVDELARLLETAQRRPLEEAKTIRRGKNKGQAIARLTPETERRLKDEGKERALIYKTLFLTGLRISELASLTVGQLHLDTKLPFVELAAADEKNRQGASIPLRHDLVDDLRAWVVLRQSRESATLKIGDSVKANVASMPILKVPSNLLRIFDRDLKWAGIPKRDERGQTLDLHALRHSFGTHLSKGGVLPRTAQAAMRHSSIELTMNVYTDPKLLDLHAALEMLPELPLTPSPKPEHLRLKSTGTSDYRTSQLVPTLALTVDFASKPLSSRGKEAALSEFGRLGNAEDASAYAVNEKGPLTVHVSDPLQVGATGFEPATSTSRT
jgi:integrase